MDYLDCVFHVFVPELRDRYRLDVLWGEAPRLELEAETGASGRAAPGLTSWGMPSGRPPSVGVWRVLDAESTMA